MCTGQRYRCTYIGCLLGCCLLYGRVVVALTHSPFPFSILYSILTIHVFRPTIHVYRPMIHLYILAIHVFRQTMHVYSQLIHVYVPTDHVFRPTIQVLWQTIQVFRPTIDLYRPSFQLDRLTILKKLSKTCTVHLNKLNDHTNVLANNAGVPTNDTKNILI